MFDSGWGWAEKVKPPASLATWPLQCTNTKLIPTIHNDFQ
jgi:hypothetical protein